jgi:hypothetical protein
MAQLKAGTTIDGRDVMLEIDNLEEEVIEHKNDYATPHIYEDEGTNPDYTGVKYRLVMIDGKPYMEVVEVAEDE